MPTERQDGWRYRWVTGLGIFLFCHTEQRKRNIHLEVIDPAPFRRPEEHRPLSSGWGPSLVPGSGILHFGMVEPYRTAVKGRDSEFWVQRLTSLLLGNMTNFSTLPNSHHADLTLSPPHGCVVNFSSAACKVSKFHPKLGETLLPFRKDTLTPTLPWVSLCHVYTLSALVRSCLLLFSTCFNFLGLRPKQAPSEFPIAIHLRGYMSMPAQTLLLDNLVPVY